MDQYCLSLEPFVSEPLGFDRFIDVTTRNGKKDGGGSVYTQSDDLGDKFIKSINSRIRWC